MIEQEKEPYFVNDIGVKYWIDEALTDWCTKENGSGVSLTDHKVFRVECPDGHKTRLLVHNGQILCDSTRLEDIACKIDFIKAGIRFERTTKK
jgi:hypothetical protein